MVEWSKAQHWKCCVGATSPRVRIPLSPPFFLAKKWRNEDASLHFTLFASCRKAAIAKALHSKGAAFSSHLHQIPEKPCL